MGRPSWPSISDSSSDVIVNDVPSPLCSWSRTVNISSWPMSNVTKDESVCKRLRALRRERSRKNRMRNRRGRTQIGSSPLRKANLGRCNESQPSSQTVRPSVRSSSKEPVSLHVWRQLILGVYRLYRDGMGWCRKMVETCSKSDMQGGWDEVKWRGGSRRVFTDAKTGLGMHGCTHSYIQVHIHTVHVNIRVIHVYR